MDDRAGLNGRDGAPQDLASVWSHLIEDLPPNQRAWLAASRPVTIHENTAIIAVADEFTRNQLEGRLRTRLEDSLTASLGLQVRLAVTVDPELETTPAPVTRTEPGLPGTDNSHLSVNHQIDLSTNPLDVPTPYQPAPSPQTPASGGSVLETRLNPKYIFETFVIGSSNRFAHAAAVAVAEAPGKAYNPLLIYGDSGLGKTHLLHAIGHYVRSLFNGARVRYVSSEEFTNEFINAIRDDKAATFQRRYRDVDVLLIDDIQFLEGKIQTQEEFFHTFNTLHNANKQIVITSDRAPKRLEALEDRLRNRFEWGLITDVQPPDLETRIAILRKKAATERMTAPPDVLEFIASKIQTNIRELEGALIRVTAFASLNRQPVDLTLAEIVLKDLIPEGGEPEITAALIIAQTAAYFGLSIDDLCGSSRSRVLVTARQIAMYLCRELTDLSLPKIGQQFGGRDHTTVMHADKKIRQLLAERRSVYNQVTELTNRIKQQARQP
ncbi:MAG TPA: chromosomal replication initiator protein DnaA [Nocardioidaceae bacterium]|nr:chromosomal replication initiator protein DnaA [Nocardioidaceae bacterium]